MRSSIRARAAAVAETYWLKGKPGRSIVTEQAVGEKIGAGSVRVVRELSQTNNVQAGEVLVAEKNDPEWEPVMRRVAAIVTTR